MEKYKRFSDPGTGINPFVPFTPKPLHGLSRWSQFAKIYIVSYLLIPLRLSLCVMLLLLYAVFCLFLPTVVFWPVPFLAQIVWKLGCCLIFRFTLIVLGFYKIQNTAWPFYVNTTLASGSAAFWQNRDKSTAKLNDRANEKENTCCSSQHRHRIIISNHCSYIDVIYYAYSCAPVYAFPVCNGHGNNTVISLGPLGALIHCLGLTPSFIGHHYHPLTFTSLMNTTVCTTPIVLFAEATTTNNRGILQFNNGPLSSLTKVQRKAIDIDVIVLQYDPCCLYFSPCFVITGSPIRHICGLFSQMYHSLVVKRIRPNEISHIPDNGDCSSWCDEVRGKMANSIQIKTVALSSKDKKLFLEQWTTNAPHRIEHRGSQK
jgi:hypothetical protein